MTDARKTGAFIARKRKEAGLTQLELAEMLGVTNRAVSKWETGAGLPDTALLTRLADALATTADALLAGGETETAPCGPAAMEMTALRTPNALAQTARAAQRPWVRPVKLLIAALAAFFVPLSPVLFDGAARVAFTLVFAAEAVLLVADAALARKTARQLRRACEGDFSPASIRVTDTACEFVRGGAQTHMEHAALREIWTARGGCVLIWTGRAAFVPDSDAAAVEHLREHAPAARERKLSRPRGMLILGTVLCAAALAAGAVLAGALETAELLADALRPYETVQSAPGAEENAEEAPRFSGAGGQQYAVTADGVWFTSDGGRTMVKCPEEGDVLAAQASGGVYAALVEREGADFCTLAAAVSSDEGQHWERTELGDLIRPADWTRLEFLSEDFGFAAAGTVWSMGGGEEKAAWATYDGGRTWQALPELPMQNSTHTLCGFRMCEDGAAALSLATSEDSDWPLVYVLDGGVWTEVQLPWERSGLPYLHSVETLERTGAGFSLTLTQQPYDTGEAVFTAPALSGPWSAG